MDKNYKTYGPAFNGKFADETLEPFAPLLYNDVMKVWKCVASSFTGFIVHGGTEDCIDVGQQSSGNTFEKFYLYPNGKYCVTIKGDSKNNLFRNVRIVGSTTKCDIEIGGWHSFNYNKPDRGNRFDSVYCASGRPVTYAYRWGCRPEFENCHVKHLWLRSLGLTAYWWAKYVWHVVLKRPDAGSTPAS